MPALFVLRVIPFLEACRSGRSRARLIVIPAPLIRVGGSFRARMHFDSVYRLGPWRPPLPFTEFQPASARGRGVAAGHPQYQPAAGTVRYQQGPGVLPESPGPERTSLFREIRHLTVSAHFLIERDGAITQFVSCHDRAWHAGVSCFDGREACNDFSLGIELEGTDTGTVHGRAVHCLGRADAAVARGLPGITRNASRATAISPRSARPIPARLSTGRATAPD